MTLPIIYTYMHRHIHFYICINTHKYIDTPELCLPVGIMSGSNDIHCIVVSTESKEILRDRGTILD